jgi:hypothetical protein
MSIAIYIYVFIGMMRVFYLHHGGRIEGDWDECAWEGGLWPIGIAADIETWWLERQLSDDQ